MNKRSVSPIIGILLMVVITIILSFTLVRLSNVYFQPAPNVILDVEVYTEKNANATKIYVKDLGGDPIYFKNKRVYVIINGHRFDFHPFTERGVLEAGDEGVLVVPLKTEVGEKTTVQLAMGGMSIFSGERTSIFYSNEVTDQKARVESIERGLLAEWHFEEGNYDDPEGDGYSVYDLSGRGCHGGFVYSGIWQDYWVKGINGMALNFTGDDYVWLVPWNVAPQKLNPRKQVTYEAWIYWINDNAGELDDLQTIYFNGHSERQLQITESDHWHGGREILFRLNTTSGTYHLYSTTKINTNEWYHIVATYDGSKMRIYINGKLDSEMPASGDIVDHDQVCDYIGIYPWGNVYKFHGIIDEVYIWDRALTPQEVKERYEMYAERIR